MSRLVIRIQADLQSLEWGVINPQDSNPKFLERGDLLLADVAALAELATEHSVRLLLPAQQVRHFFVEAPTKNRKHLEKAAPYLLEEQIIENVETQHFALGKIDSGNQLAVNVISKSYFSDLLDALKTADIIPDECFVDASCLPEFDDAWTLLNSEPVLVKESHGNFWSSESSMLTDILQWNLTEQAEKESKVSQAIRVFSENQKSLDLSHVAGLAAQPMALDDEFLWLASQDNSSSINLLQQAFEQEHKSKQGLGAWKLPFIAAVFMAVIGLGYFGSQYYIAVQNKNFYQDLALQEIQKINSNVTEDNLLTKIQELNNKAARSANGSNKAPSFIGLLNKVYAVLSPAQIKLQQLEYQAKTGNLNLDVEASNYQLLTKAQQDLEAARLKVEMKNARDNDGRWSTRLIIKN